jgi:hypothetical protein
MRFLTDLGTPPPRAFSAVADLVLNGDLRRALDDPETHPDEVRRLIAQAHDLGVHLEQEGLAYAVKGALGRRVDRLREQPEDPRRLEEVESLIGLIRTLPFPVDLWLAQNRYYEILQSTYPKLREQAEAGKKGAQDWVERFRVLGDELRVRVP